MWFGCFTYVCFERLVMALKASVKKYLNAFTLPYFGKRSHKDPAFPHPQLLAVLMAFLPLFQQLLGLLCRLLRSMTFGKEKMTRAK